jgi:cell division septation protein DedD
MTVRMRVAMLIAAGAVAASSLRAQTDPRLAAAVAQAREGQSDSARAAVARLLAATPSTDSLYPQMLYSAALVAADVVERERTLQRIVVEYSLSDWADDALLLLGQSDYAGGNLPGASRDLERIRSDFPTSPLMAKAAFWAARTYFDMNNPAAACRWVALGLPRAGDDTETRNQLAFQSQRCGGVRVAADSAPAPRPSAPPAATRDTSPAPTAIVPPPAAAQAADTTTTAAPTESAGRFRVQLAAAGSAAEAAGIVRGLTAKGFDVDVTQEKGYFKVRTGHFATRREAQAEANRLKARLGGGPFVVGP